MAILNFKPLLEAKSRWVWLDLVMIWLVLINLGLIIFDSLFAMAFIQDGLRSLLGDTPVDFYDRWVHQYFLLWDLGFIAIFLTEFLFRWAIAVRQREHDHWAIYPLVHWYDILGCIPVGELRWLRLFRVIAVMYRLHRIEVINLNNWPIVRLARRLYDIVMEEISDRVVVRVLGGVQDEIRQGLDLEQKIVEDILQPRKQALIDGIAGSVASTIQTAYGRNREDLEGFIKARISKAMHDNIEIKTLDRIPLLGGFAAGRLDHAVNDIVCSVIDELINSLGSDEFTLLFGEISDAAFDGLMRPTDQDSVDDRMAIQTAVVDVLEIVKQQVARRRWAETGETT